MPPSGDSLIERSMFPDKTGAAVELILMAYLACGRAGACCWVVEWRIRTRQIQPLHVGDRVRTTVPRVDLPAGDHGIVRAIFPLGDVYAILIHAGDYESKQVIDGKAHG